MQRDSALAIGDVASNEFTRDVYCTAEASAKGNRNIRQCIQESHTEGTFRDIRRQDTGGIPVKDVMGIAVQVKLVTVAVIRGEVAEISRLIYVRLAA